MNKYLKWFFSIRVNIMSEPNPQPYVKWELSTISNMWAPVCLFQLEYEED